jgi:DNA replication protein DnaC
MKQISKIYNKRNQPPQPTYDYQRRPVVKMEFNSFYSKLVENSNHILRERGVDREFKLFEEDKAIIQQLYLYATCNKNCQYDLNKGLLLMGTFGNGKSLLLRALSMIFNQDNFSKRVKIMSAESYIDELRQNSLFASEMRKRPLLIDDAGKEPMEIVLYGERIKPISSLLAKRYDHGGFTFMTSNYGAESLTKHYGAHIGDRLNEMFNLIVKEGQSRRG